MSAPSSAGRSRGAGAAAAWHEATVPADGPLRGRLLALHGFAEHGGRYLGLARAGAAHGFEVTLPDLPGHGRSDGPRGLVTDAERLAGRVAQRLVALRAGGVPVVAFGHSFGGALLLRAAQLRPDALDALVVSAPYLTSARGDPPWLMRLATVASGVVPRLRSRRIDAGVVSSLEAEVAAYENDPLVDRGGVRLASVRELHALGPRVLADAPSLSVPTWVVHGDADGLADVAGSRALAAAAPTATLEEVPGGAHGLLHDRGASELAERIVAWLAARSADGAASSDRAAAAGT